MIFHEIFKKEDYLGNALKYVIDNNEANLLPYHNLNHNIVVTSYCYYIAETMNINKNDKKHLLLSALFHDFNHSGGKEKDNVNVSLAKKGLEKYIKENKINIDINKCFEILDATQYPYIIEDDKLNNLQMIIRDADLCQLFENTRLYFNFYGLKTEMNIDFKDMLVGQKKFIDSIKFNTTFGKELFKQKKKLIMDELDYLIEIYK